MSPIIQNLIKAAPEQLAALLTESADQIDAAIVSAATEAQAQESAAKLAIPFGIVVNIDKSAFEFSLGWSVKHKLTSACPPVGRSTHTESHLG